MAFAGRTIYSAGFRQDKKDGYGTWCAMCCINVGLAREYPIPRIPIAKGGDWSANNCVILCEKCFAKIGFDHIDEIPYSELPCFKV